MAIQQFSEFIQSAIYKDWLSKLDKNLVNSTVNDIRSREQKANKTDFVISTSDIKRMYKQVTDKELTTSKAKTVLKKIAQVAGSDVVGKALRVGNSGGIFFESIGFDTITNRVASIFDELDGVQDAYEAARDKFLARKFEEIASDPKLKRPVDIQTARDKAEKQASKMGFGEFLHKGHVVSIATNSAKEFRQSLIDASDFEAAQKDLLLGVLDKYIQKLEQDDLASANLPNAINQKLYAKYIKSSAKYLVEIQFSTDNLESGSASLPIVNELRNIFTNSKELTEVFLKSPAIGKKLLNTKGSPSYLELLAKDLAASIVEGKITPQVYSIPNTLVANTKRPIKKSNNKSEIAKVKALQSKVKNTKKIRVPSEAEVAGAFKDPQLDLFSLTSFINQHLQDVVSANMGDDNRKDVLNYRSGRLASSAKVERMSQSREGMITAFYSYMKNPYATFSEGGEQQYPKTRDPKLLISKSIREIAAEKVSNRLRAVVV